MRRDYLFITIFFTLTLFFGGIYALMNYKKDLAIKEAYKSYYRENKSLFENENRLLNFQARILYDLIVDGTLKWYISQFALDNNNSSIYKDLIEGRVRKFSKVLKKYNVLHLHIMLKSKSIYEMNKVVFKNDYKFGFYSKPYSTFVITQKGVGYLVSYPIKDRKNNLIGNFAIVFDYLKVMKMFFKENIYIALFKKYGEKLNFCKLNNEFYLSGDFCKKYGFKNLFFLPGVVKYQDYVVIAIPIYEISDKIGYVVKVEKEYKFEEIYKIHEHFEKMTIILFVFYVVSLIIVFGIVHFLDVYKKASVDRLTNLLNRQGCAKKLKTISNYSLLVIDIDYFKKVNDTYGHDIGDEVLKEVANILKNSLRKSDIICRWGGEEFIVILPNTSLEMAYEIGERLRKNIENCKNFPYDLKVTISVGVASSKGDFQQTFKSADENLYLAKKSGRNRVIF